MSIPCCTDLMSTDDLLAHTEGPMEAKDKAGMPRQGLSRWKTLELPEAASACESCAPSPAITGSPSEQCRSLQ